MALKEHLRPCKNSCGLDVCSETCQNSSSHSKECKLIGECTQKRSNVSDQFRQDLYENLTPLRSLFLDECEKDVVSCLIAHDREEHGHEIEALKNKLGFEFTEEDEIFLRFVCCVMDANAFEVIVGNEENTSSVRALYPLGSLANHSCIPNTLHVFNDEQQMVVKATTFIQKNVELFHSYTRIIWGTTTRLYHLHKTKHFICKCARCEDPTEFGTYMGSVLCKLCRGIVSSTNPEKAFARWQCQDCKNLVSGRDVGQLTALLGKDFVIINGRFSMLDLLGSILRNVESNDYPFMYRLLNGKLKSVVPENNQVAVELKYKIVWILGYKVGYMWGELTLEQLKIKEQICKDILELLEKLRCGQSKMRGLLLYELCCCKRETINRTNNCNQNSIPVEIRDLLSEAASILQYDTSAPEEIKQICQNNKPHPNKILAV
ncbi:hypothetical protein D910_08853 [Dendroctonus ponderosae]|uniref:SET domain-containing protein n=1 Tax=Dendroctonus ponderosae TaxID=77166 RepID=U4UGP7_DENPD|nr:hypothetical protein D910_08853 [Dendroctonus ponderosae]